MRRDEGAPRERGGRQRRGQRPSASQQALPDAVREQLRALIIEELSQLIKG